MNFKRTVLFILASVSFSAAAQVFDTTGNIMLNGKYYFREVFLSSSDAVALYGNISFSSGTYTISGAQWDHCNQSGCTGQVNYLPPSGTYSYSISASGYGFISSPLGIGAQVYGLVGANGVFVGSSTESGANDLFIAAPVTSQSTSTLQGSYTLTFMDLTGLVDQQSPLLDAQLQMASNGSGTIGTVNVSANIVGYGTGTQSISGVKYRVSNNAFVVTFPTSSSSSALIQGDEYLYSTPDGSFVFGGSPVYFDMMIGVRGASTSGLGGLYYQAGLDMDSSSGSLDTYYGAFSASSGAIVGHERLQFGSGSATDYTYYDKYQAASSSYTDTATSTQYTIGSGGVRVGLGTGSSLGVAVAVPAPSLSGSGVYLNPTGVVNAASFAPFTAGMSRGEMITLFGTNLGPSTPQQAAVLPLPNTLGGVQVLINNLAAPIFYVSSNQLSAIVPWETTSSIAQIQVVNNGAMSNVVTEYVSKATPGVFGGIGYAAAEHVDYSVVTPSNPAQVGETIAVYVTGLGDVFPSIADGAAGTVSATSNAITADVGGIAATVAYAGLAPGLVGLYQVNIQIPSGVTNGDNTLDIGSKDGTSYTIEALIPVTGGVAPTAVPGARLNVQRRPPTGTRFHRWEKPR